MCWPSYIIAQSRRKSMGFGFGELAATPGLGPCIRAGSFSETHTKGQHMPLLMVRGLRQMVPIPWNIAGLSATTERGDVCLRTCRSASPFPRQRPTHTLREGARDSQGRAFLAQIASPVRLGHACKTTTQSPGAHPLLPLDRCPSYTSLSYW